MEPPKKKKPLDNYVKYSSFAFQMAIIIFIFIFVGQKVDNLFKTPKPYFTAFFSVIGVFFSMYQIIKNVQSDS
jgi:ATP synthase protein I